MDAQSMRMLAPLMTMMVGVVCGLVMVSVLACLALLQTFSLAIV